MLLYCEFVTKPYKEMRFTKPNAAKNIMMNH